MYNMCFKSVAKQKHANQIGKEYVKHLQQVCTTICKKHGRANQGQKYTNGNMRNVRNKYANKKYAKKSGQPGATLCKTLCKIRNTKPRFRSLRCGWPQPQGKIRNYRSQISKNTSGQPGATICKHICTKYVTNMQTICN